MKALHRRIAIFLLISLLNALLGIVAISQLPERVATHFNAAFEADKMGSPWTYLVCFLIPPLISFGFLLENKLGKSEKNKRMLTVKLAAVASLVAYVGWLMVLWCGKVDELGQKSEAPLNLLMCVPLGALLSVIGNYLPTVKRNAVLGIRTPATLKSDYVWQQTHRIMGKIWVAIGIGEIFFAVFDTLTGSEILSLVWLCASLAGAFVALPFLTRFFRQQENQSKQ